MANRAIVRDPCGFASRDDWPPDKKKLIHMKTKFLFPMCAPVLIMVFAASGQTNAPMTDIGPATPPPGPYDIGQTMCSYCASAHGTHDGPDGLNYYTDNGANHGLWAGQTFTTGTNSADYNLASV